LAINFDSRNFENVTIQKFYSGLQALALGDDEQEEVEDCLKPDAEGMKQYEPLIDNFKALLFDGNDQDIKCASLLPKAKAAPKKAGSSSGATKTTASTTGAATKSS